MLELNGVCSFYGNIQALHNVSLKVHEGEIITLIGANGAGKSTTLMTICGLVKPRSGQINFCGQAIHRMQPEQIVRMGLVQVPEGRRIFPNMSVLENLEMGAYLRRDKEAVRHDIDKVMELFPILSQRKSQLGGTLSGGEQQMLAISRALMSKPRLLVLDEPSLGLAPLVIKQIFEIIKMINREHATTVFLVEQNANQALKLADRGYVMENGRIIMTNTAVNLMNNDQVRAAYLGL